MKKRKLLSVVLATLMTLDALCFGLTLTYHLTSCDASNASVSLKIADGPLGNYTTDVVVVQPSYESNIVGIIDDTTNNNRFLIVKPDVIKGQLSFNNNVSDRMVAENMFPGDSISKTYSINVAHNYKNQLLFEIDVHDDPEYQKLAEVLKVKISINGQEYYDGFLADCGEIYTYLNSYDYYKAINDTVEYTITVYLDTSVGNDYMQKTLVCDYKWTLLENGTIEELPDILIPIDPEKPKDDDDDDKYIEDEVNTDEPEEAYSEIIIFDTLPEPCYAKQILVFTGVVFAFLAVACVVRRRKGDNYEK